MSATYAGGGFFLVFLGIILLVIAFYLYNRNNQNTNMVTTGDNTTAYVIGGVGIFFIFIGIIIGLYGLYEYSNKKGEDPVDDLKKEREKLDKKQKKLEEKSERLAEENKRQREELNTLRTQNTASQVYEQKLEENVNGTRLINANSQRNRRRVYVNNPQPYTYSSQNIQPVYRPVTRT